jgi:phosphate transport system permease protein
MSGLPSIVAGLFIFAVFVSSGLSRPAGWLASSALVLLMLPTVIRMSEEVLKLVPGDLRSAALALGAPQRRAFVSLVRTQDPDEIIKKLTVFQARELYDRLKQIFNA